MKRMRSIQSQMILFFSVLLIVPLILSLIYVYVMFQMNLEETYARHQRQATDALSVDVAKWRETYEDLSLLVFGDQTIQQFLQSTESLDDARYSSLRSNTRTKLVHYMEYSPRIKGIYLLDNNNRAIGSSDPSFAIIQYLQSLTPIAEEGNGHPRWDSSRDEHSITIFRKIVDNRHNLNQGIGYLFIIVERTELNNSFDQFTLDAGQHFGLADNLNGIYIATSEELSPDYWSPHHGEGGRVGYHIIETRDGNYVYYGIERDGWLLATWIAEAANLEPIRRTLVAVIIISAALLIYMIVMIVFVSNRITKPLRLIYRAIKRIGSGHSELKVPVMRDDEIGQVATNLNNMSEEIERLIEQNRTVEAKRRIIQLRTMEYQINPHFLYNTLDSVNMLSRKYDDQRIGDIVTSLSRLFRIGLNQGREMTTVEHELEHVGYYLKIQKIRFAEQLLWEIHSDESIHSDQIIKFILQPLVENSIIHGIRKRSLAGMIRISAIRESDHIRFEVSDNGVGMARAKLNELRETLDKEFTEEIESALTNTGFGLWNVHQRIKLHYGNKYGLMLDSREGEGTVVQIRLPINRISDKNE
jgi:two-component system, sensor histidine kinase YesM